MSTTCIKSAGKTRTRVTSGQQVVAVHVGDQIFGVALASVRTVLPTPGVTERLTREVNVLGRRVPLIDLRTVFGKATSTEISGTSTRTVVVQAGHLTVGLLVDGVSEVLHLQDRYIKTTSDEIDFGVVHYVSGCATIPKASVLSRKLGKGRSPIHLLNVPQMLSLESANSSAKLSKVA